MQTAKKILLTGLPGCGKTTAIVRIINALAGKSVAGFYTREIRTKGTRQGFQWNRLDGQVGILAHVDFKGPYRVGRYGVDIQGFEDSVVKYLNPAGSDAELFIIDEIGRMECLSERFVKTIRGLFAADKTVIATIAQGTGPFISEIKRHPGAKLLTLTRSNRDTLINQILDIISDQNTQ